MEKNNIDNNSNRVFNFIRDYVGDKEIKLSLDMDLQQDLEIYGDDSVDFILKFSKEFDVDVSKFELSLFFKGEGFDLLGMFKKKKERLSLYIRDLVNSLDKGILIKENTISWKR